MADYTEEQIAKHYSAMLDSANLIMAGNRESQTEEEWEGVKKRNQEHLSLMLSKSFLTSQDLTLISAAIKA